MSATAFIAVNWGSSTFAAYLIEPASGIVDRHRTANGVTRLDRDALPAALAEAVVGWPKTEHIYCSGMIGSSAGWVEVPHLDCPATLLEVSRSLTQTRIGDVNCSIVPGLAAILPNGDPDVLRGEEMEIFGLVALQGAATPTLHAVLPGTHTKWVRVSDGSVSEFFTSMGGELFDRLAEKSLLSSVLDKEQSAISDEWFARGVERGAAEGTGLGRLLFGVRAQVLRARLPKAHAASYARGLLIGAEIEDAIRMQPQIRSQASIPLVGNPALCELYRGALAQFGVGAHLVDGASCLLEAYRILHHNVVGARP
ncbi:MAG: 2-dehydro-3-deoxygalactonokinase [Pseudomonadota bacterium]